MSRLTAASGPPRSGLVINKTVTSYHNCSQLFFCENQSFSTISEEGTFVIRFNSTGVPKPKFPVITRLSTASCPPRSGIVKNKTVTSYHNSSQLSLAKTKASFLYNKRVRTSKDSPQQEGKNSNVLSCQDYQQLAEPHCLG